MKRNTRGLAPYVFLCLLGMMLVLPVFTGTACAENVVIIGNADVSDSSLSSEDLRNIFLNKKTRWSDGKKIVFVTLRASDTHNAFLKQYIRRTVSQFRNFWKKQVFTGKGKMPVSFATEKEMVDFVSRTEGAIGYISAAPENDVVKTFQIQ